MALDQDIKNLLRVTLYGNAVLEAEKITLTFDQLVVQWHASGMSDQAIRELVLKDFARQNPVFFGQFRSGMKELIAGAMHQGYQAGVTDQYQALPEDTQYRWTTVKDDSVCEDCDLREGDVRTLTEWQTLGLPKSGFSRCGRRCRCEITPEALDAPTRMEIKT